MEQVGNGSVRSESIERESGKTDEAEYGHLEELEIFEAAHRVNPLLRRHEVEAFPHQTASKTGEEESQQDAVAATLELGEERARPAPVVPGVDEKAQGSPHQRSEVVGEREGEGDHEGAQRLDRVGNPGAANVRGHR